MQVHAQLYKLNEKLSESCTISSQECDCTMTAHLHRVVQQPKNPVNHKLLTNSSLHEDAKRHTGTTANS